MTHFSPTDASDMATIQHCVTLIPCSTLEDFPAGLDDAAARSLLAAWTAPWHPRLIAATGRLPQWSRADTLPDPLENKAIFVASPCELKLPRGFDDSAAAVPSCRVLRATDRSGFLRAIEGLLPAGAIASIDTDGPVITLDSGERLVSADDFFALAYAWLQVQLMTRRLRYTSNLDEIFFASRVVEAAQRFVAGDAKATVDALHEAFDALAQERDHYFSNDPHLVDLTLLASTTLDDRLAKQLSTVGAPHSVPMNFLIDASMAPMLSGSPLPAVQQLSRLIESESVGIAGGGLATDRSVHHLTAQEAHTAVIIAKETMDQVFGGRCAVYARAAGPTPSDLAPAVAAAGYVGAIPTNFAAGEGWASESKLIWSSSLGSIDVLTAKPMDGSSSTPFLTLAVRLGQAIDSGEVATALIVHWPGHESDSYRDLRCAASWGLSLGRFWKIDDYFREGQRPYHHFRGQADEGASQWLSSAVASQVKSPLRHAATAFRKALNHEASLAVQTLADLIKPMQPDVTVGDLPGSREIAAISLSPHHSHAHHGIAELDQYPRSEEPPPEENEDAAEAFCERLSACPQKKTSGAQPPAREGCIVVNPHGKPTRVSLLMDAPPSPNPAIFGTSLGIDGRHEITVDIPAQGFVALSPATAAPKRSWLSRPKRIAKNNLLINEFMQVEISPKSGGVMGVYSGPGRGNRFSSRLVRVDDDLSEDERETEMLARAVRVVRSDEAVGVIEVDGVLVTRGERAAADFTLRYSLSRGSRWLWTEAEVKPATSTAMGENPWKSYFAFRSAFSTEAANCFALLRDKLHRTDEKRLDAPGGLLIDEHPRQTLLYAEGRPAFRRRGDRFVDSLAFVRGEAFKPVQFAVGFDVPAPVEALRALVSPPFVITCKATQSVPPSGWLVNCVTSDVSITDLRTESTSPLVLTCLLIANRAESRRAKVRFCRDVVRAQQQTASALSGTAEGVSGVTSYQDLAFNGDSIEVALAGYEVIRIRVELKI